jgi:hypothetical protein
MSAHGFTRKSLSLRPVHIHFVIAVWRGKAAECDLGCRRRFLAG